MPVKIAYNFSNAVFIAIIVAIIRIYFLSLEQFGLFFDEAQYWTWAKDVDWGYYSKPPVIGWLIAATTGLCGDESYCVRLGSPILHSLTAIIIFLIGKKLYNQQTAFWSSITYLTLPAVTLSSAFISSDAPLMFFWAASLYLFTHATDGRNPKWWIFLSISVGLGLLSKYTMLVFPLAALLYIIFSGACRRLLYNKYLYISAFIGLLVFFPNILWNYSNNFASFSHTEDNVLSLSVSFYPLEGLKFLASQFAVFGPVLFVSLFWVALHSLKLWKNENNRLAIFFIIPLDIAVIIAFISSAQAHWAAPAYISATILVVNFLLEKKKIIWLKASLTLHVFIAILFFFSSNFTSLVERPFERVEVWNGTAEPVIKALSNHPDAFLASNERKIIAPLMYNLRSEDGTPYKVLKWNPYKTVRDHYDLSTDINSYKGKNFVFISRTPFGEYDTKYFSKLSKIDEVKITSKTFYIYYLQGFKGY